MTARYVFKVGPVNRNSDYAHTITVYGDTYIEARDKAIAFRGLRPSDTKTWMISVDEVDPNFDVLERLAALLKENE